ncbi:hypothetical protein SFRURICE_009989 [Spodoptera frugiperda]|nr:hypothetical protein SFRURICE_009989 [Spodoptera frugiperda]
MDGNCSRPEEMAETEGDLHPSARKGILLATAFLLGFCMLTSAVEEVLKCPRSPSTPKRGRKRPGASLRQRSQNGPSRQRRRYI